LNSKITNRPSQNLNKLKRTLNFFFEFKDHQSSFPEFE